MSFGFLSLIAPVAVPGDAVAARPGAEDAAGFEAVLATVSAESETPSANDATGEDLPLDDTNQLEDAASTALPAGLLAPAVVLQARPLEVATTETDVVSGGAPAMPSAPTPADAPLLDAAPDPKLPATAPTPEVSGDVAPDVTAADAGLFISPEKIAPEATKPPQPVAPSPSTPSAPSASEGTKIVESAASPDAGGLIEVQPSGSTPKIEHPNRVTVDVPALATTPDRAATSGDGQSSEIGVPSRSDDKQPPLPPQAHATSQSTTPAPVVSRVGSRGETEVSAPQTEESSKTEIAAVDPGLASGEETPPPPSDSPVRLQKSERSAQSERALSIAHAAAARSEDENDAKQAPQGVSAPASADVPERTRGAPASVAAATAPQAPLDGPIDAPVASLSSNAAASDHTGAALEPVSAGATLLSRVSVETTAQIAAQIVRRLEGRSTRFEMALTPDDLGRVDVSMEVGADGALTARLAFDNPAAAAELRGRADELRRQLQDAGFQLTQDSLQFSQRDGSQSRREFDRRPDRAFSGAARLAADADAAAPIAGRWTPLTLAPRGVDMKV